MNRKCAAWKLLHTCAQSYFALPLEISGFSESYYTLLRTSADVATRPWQTPRIACRRSQTITHLGVWKRSMPGIMAAPAAIQPNAHIIAYRPCITQGRKGPVLPISLRQSYGGLAGDSPCFVLLLHTTLSCRGMPVWDNFSTNRHLPVHLLPLYQCHRSF